MNTISSDIKEYMLTFGQGSEKGSMALATQLDPNIIISRIKEINSSFFLLDLLCTKLEQEERLAEIKKRASYRFYQMIGDNYVSLTLISSDISVNGASNLINIGIAPKMYDKLSSFFGNEIQQLDYINVGYPITTGKGCIIEDRYQFLSDLNFLKRYYSKDTPGQISITLNE